MDFFKNAADSVSKAVEYVMDRNRKAAIINRLNIVIRNERDNQNRAYIALGKYYFTRLRDPENEVTEPLCSQAETAGRRLQRAYAKLDDLTVPQESRPSEEIDEDDECGDECGDSARREAEDDEPEGPSSDPDAEAENDEEFLRPLTVVPNDVPTEGKPGDGGQPGEDET